MRSIANVPPVAVARLSLGDPAAATDWAPEIRARAASQQFPVGELSPLWMFPDDPVLKTTADALFVQAGSPLSPAMRFEYVNSPLLTVSACRQAVILALADTKVFGTATRSEEGLLSFRTIAGTSGGFGEPGHDPRQIPPGQERPVRVKDFVASELSGLDGAPEFELDCPKPTKTPRFSKSVSF